MIIVIIIIVIYILWQMAAKEKKKTKIKKSHHQHQVLIDACLYECCCCKCLTANWFLNLNVMAVRQWGCEDFTVSLTHFISLHFIPFQWKWNCLSFLQFFFWKGGGGEGVVVGFFFSVSCFHFYCDNIVNEIKQEESEIENWKLKF